MSFKDKYGREIHVGDTVKTEINVYEVEYDKEKKAYLLYPANRKYFVYLAGFTPNVLEVIDK